MRTRQLLSQVKLLRILVGLVSAIAAGSASADTLFSDDFNRPVSFTVGNGWTEDPAANAGIVTGGNPDNAMLLAGNPESGPSFDVIASHVNISTIGMTDIRFSFDWKGVAPADNLDRVFAAYSVNGGTDWINLTPIGLSLGASDWVTAQYSISPNADNRSSLGIRFATFVNYATEGVRIDNVSITGAAAIPEPEIYAMLGVGLGFMAGVGRRRKLQG